MLIEVKSPHATVTHDTETLSMSDRSLLLRLAVPHKLKQNTFKDLAAKFEIYRKINLHNVCPAGAPKHTLDNVSVAVQVVSAPQPLVEELKALITTPTTLIFKRSVLKAYCFKCLKQHVAIKYSVTVRTTVKGIPMQKVFEIKPEMMEEPQ